MRRHVVAKEIEKAQHLVCGVILDRNRAKIERLLGEAEAFVRAGFHVRDLIVIARNGGRLAVQLARDDGGES